MLKTNTQPDGIPLPHKSQVPQARNDDVAATRDGMDTQSHENGIDFTNLHELPRMNRSNGQTTNTANTTDSFSWEMIGLGLEEPLPTQETIQELYAV
jgi:hypothetical protein